MSIGVNNKLLLIGLSSSTINNTKDDSSYVLPPDTSLDQSSELCTNIEDETTENLEDTRDNESVFEELINKLKPSKLDDLEVPRAGEETKKSFCCFCFHSFVVISRHYEAIHSDEKEVQHFLSLKKSKFIQLSFCLMSHNYEYFQDLLKESQLLKSYVSRERRSSI